MAINQISTSNTFGQWIDATRALIAMANGLTDGVAAGQQFTVNTAIVVNGAGAYLDVKTNATFNVIQANTLTVGGTQLKGFSSIQVSGQDSVVANGLSSNVTFANGAGLTIQTDANTDTVTFSIIPGAAAGYTGSQGATGFTGSVGPGGTGSIGYTGSQGAIGYTGSQGAQGGIGYTGSQGTQGEIGYTGSIGAQGYTGSKGDGYFGIPPNVQSTPYQLTGTDVGKHINTTANVTVPSGVFTSGDAISVYNNSGSTIYINQSGTTIRLAGTATAGNRAVGQYGLVTVVCVGTNSFVASGAGMT